MAETKAAETITRRDSSAKDPEKWLAEDVQVETTSSAYVVDPEAEKRLVRRIDIRLVPASMAIYLLCFLDRSNIGNAKLLNSATGDSLIQTIHMSNQQYLVALMIFIVAYTVFETPSNYMLKRFRPSRWLAFLMFGWGSMTMVLGAVHNFAGVVAVRFLLGMFEAGLFPGMVYCLTFWYKPEERALRAALILACATLGGAFGGAIAYAVGHMNRVQGLQAWRWLFILEGAPSCAAAFLTFIAYPNFPETEKWLSPEERELATERIKGVASLGHDKIVWSEALETLLDWRLYLHYAVYIAVSVPFSSISLFAPTIVSGLGYEGLDAQLFTVPPYAIAFVITVIVSWTSDRYEMRSWGSFISLVVAGISFLIQGALPPLAFKARYGLLCVAVSFSFASIPPLLSWLTANLRSTGAATLAVPLNVSIGQFGQIIGVYIFKSSEAPGYPTGHFTNAAFLLVGALVVLVLRWIYARRNKRMAIGERPWRL
ncbi:MFS transporter [Panus rudis PR-1116 ss-1]|nr:MFS transporter [Panus rudis PR-1116 ss-1]